MIYESRRFSVKDGLEVELKTPERKDAQQLLEFIRNLVSQTPFLLSTVDDLSMTVEQEADFIENNRAGDVWFLCVYVDGKIVGDCHISFNKHEKDKHRANVGIGIDEAYCNKGIGSLLFDELIRLAEEKNGIEQIELGVFSSNLRAKHLYEKKGFKYYATVPHAFKQKDGTYEDEELMIKYL